MGQHEIAEYLYENGESTRKQIQNSVQISSTSVSESLSSLKQKELITETDGGFAFHPNANEDDLKSIEPTSLRDALDSE